MCASLYQNNILRLMTEIWITAGSRSYRCLNKFRLPLLSNPLDFKLDLHIVPDHEAARVECLIPCNAEVLPVYLSLGGERGALVSHRVLSLAAVLGVELYLLRNAVYRKVADDNEIVPVTLLHFLALEGYRGIFGDVEEVRRLQVIVSLLLVRIFARRGDGRIHARFADVLVVERV